MSTFDDAMLPPDYDRFEGRWMDGEPVETAGSPEPDTVHEHLAASNDGERLSQARRQLVHALLLHLDKSGPSAQQERVDRALRGIRDLPDHDRDSPQTQGSLCRRLRWPIRLALAASLLVGVGISFYALSSNAAPAALDRVVQAIDDSGDRTYKISVEPPDDPVSRRLQGNDTGRPIAIPCRKIGVRGWTARRCTFAAVTDSC